MISTGNEETGGVDYRAWRRLAVQMPKLGEVESTPETDLTRDLLTATLKGLAYVLVERSGSEKWISHLRNTSRQELEKLQGDAPVVTATKSIKVPKNEGHDNKLVRQRLHFCCSPRIRRSSCA